MNWIYGIASLLIAYFMVKGCRGTQRMRRDTKTADRRLASDLYDLKRLEVQGYMPVEEYEGLVGGRAGKEWLN